MGGPLRACLRVVLTFVPLVATVACREPSPSGPLPPDVDAGVTSGGVDAGRADGAVEEAGAQDARTSDAGRSDAGQTPGALALPIVAQATTTLYAVPNFPAPLDRSVLRAEAPLNFALAEGYPTAVTAKFMGRYYTGFGPLNGTLTFERLEIPANGADFVSAELVAGGVHVAVSREGTTTLIAHATYVPTAEERSSEALMGLSTVPFALHIPVRARRVVGSRFVLPYGCTEPLYAATSSVLPLLSVGLVDTDGELLYPSNMQPARAVSTTVEAETGFAFATPSDDEGIEALRLPDVATRVTVRPAIGEPLQIQVVDAASITKADVSFSIAGYAGGSLELVDGMSYPGSWHRVSNCVAPIVPEVYAGTNALCSRPNPAWFVLLSDTPAQCEVRPLASTALDSLVLPIPDIGLTAFVRTDGECALRLRGAGFAGGAGLEYRVKVMLSNVAQMHQIE